MKTKIFTLILMGLFMISCGTTNKYASNKFEDPIYYYSDNNMYTPETDLLDLKGKTVKHLDSIYVNIQEDNFYENLLKRTMRFNIAVIGYPYPWQNPFLYGYYYSSGSYYDYNNPYLYYGEYYPYYNYYGYFGPLYRYYDSDFKHHSTKNLGRIYTKKVTTPNENYEKERPTNSIYRRDVSATQNGPRTNNQSLNFRKSTTPRQIDRPAITQERTTSYERTHKSDDRPNSSSYLRTETSTSRSSGGSTSSGRTSESSSVYRR